MALVVQKYGGSSVADADKIKRVARRIASRVEAGDRVVAVVSAMGDTTDDLIELAQQVSSKPHPREMDVLMHTG
ncbi:MAG: aspartate kinase, partial [Dehalococcoidia bacterium]|nr:aspartate kinase [Dehalococcoidia bacterium]